MEVIRLQNETPEVYTEQSRDFQLLCRLYDCLINSTKFDVDTMKKISDTHSIRTTLLPLLQTKVGFFSNAKTNDETLRLILEVFPLLLKSKGSLKAVTEAINVYLRILGIHVPITITKTDGPTQLYNITIPDHTVVIGLSTAFRNTEQVFRDLLRYIMPAGFNSYIYFYSSINDLTTFLYKDTVAIIYISDDVNSQIRANSDNYSSNLKDRLIGNVALMEVGSEPVNYPTLDTTINVDIHEDGE